MDGINTRAGAGITTNWASRGSGGFGRGVGHRVTRSAASTLECVVESEPVADLVGHGLALIVVGLTSTGSCRAQDAASIVEEIVATTGSRDWEVAVSQVVHGFHEIQVEILVSSLAESLLHSELRSISSPSRVDGPISTSQGK